MDGLYAYEKLTIAVECLAAGSGTLRERLLNAYVSSLMRISPDADIPWSDIRSRFFALADEIAPNGRPDIALATWEEIELKRLVEEVVSIYGAVCKRIGD